MPRSEPALWLMLIALTAIWPTKSGDWSQWVCLVMGMRIGWVALDWMEARGWMN